jgi:hypothetical protein
MAASERSTTSNGRRQIGYFCHLSIDEKHLGAILVTNQIGVPVEFKYTEPVAATRLHRVLYGAVLERYLHETVIRDRLGREIRSLPDYFIAPYSEREYLGPLAGRAMMAVQRANLTAGESSGTFTRIRDREVIAELEDGPALRIAFSTVDDAEQHHMLAWLQEFARTMDVLEPLDRAAAALEILCLETRKA